MDLKFVKTTKCPVCGCDIVVKESVESDYNNTAIRQHCNGGLWEHREFLCGYIASYEPNFDAERTHESTMMRCRNNPKVIERNKKREALKQQIQATIKTADCDEDFKRRLMGKTSKKNAAIARLRIQVKQAEMERDAERQKVDEYATSARSIALWLSKYCDRNLPYPQMINDAVRKAAQALSSAEERAEKAERKLLLLVEERNGTQKS